MHFNQVTLVGRLTADPEFKILGETKQVVNFTIAVDRVFKDKDGDKVTDFFNIIAWDKTAKFVADYIDRGDLVLVAGSMQNNLWIDNNNNTRINTRIVAQTVTSLEKKPLQTQQQEADPDYR